MKYVVSASTGHESLYANPVGVFDTRELAILGIEGMGEHCDSDVNPEVYRIDATRKITGRVIHFWIEDVTDNRINLDVLGL